MMCKELIPLTSLVSLFGDRLIICDMHFIDGIVVMRPMFHSNVLVDETSGEHTQKRPLSMSFPLCLEGTGYSARDMRGSTTSVSRSAHVLIYNFDTSKYVLS